nr:hypothetical protein [Bacteroidota bacterium]
MIIDFDERLKPYGWLAAGLILIFNSITFYKMQIPDAFYGYIIGPILIGIGLFKLYQQKKNAKKDANEIQIVSDNEEKNDYTFQTSFMKVDVKALIYLILFFFAIVMVFLFWERIFG